MGHSLSGLGISMSLNPPLPPPLEIILLLLVELMVDFPLAFNVSFDAISLDLFARFLDLSLSRFYVRCFVCVVTSQALIHI